MPTTIDLLLDREIPHHTPDQLHGLACSLFEGEGVEHGAPGKGFTIWPLREEREGQVLRLTLLGSEDQCGRPLPSSLRLGSRSFQVRRRHDTFVPFVGIMSGPPRMRTTLSFETPTYFSRSGRDLPLPDPTLVFRSLGMKWNLHAPAGLLIDDDILRTLLGTVFVSAADVQTLTTEAAHRTRRTGFVGWASFELTPDGHPAAEVFGTLSRAAEYLGVGAQTTRGYGVALETNS